LNPVFFGDGTIWSSSDEKVLHIHSPSPVHRRRRSSYWLKINRRGQQTTAERKQNFYIFESYNSWWFESSQSYRLPGRDKRRSPAGVSISI